MTSDRIDELIALAALGELTAADERELDQATRADGAVAEELADALATAAALQRPAVEDPPPRLRDNVLAAISETPQEGSDVGPGEGGRGDTTPVVVPITSARSRRWLPVLAGVAAAAVLLVGGIVVVSQNDADTDDLVAVTEASDAVTQVLTGELGADLLVTYSESEGAVVVEGQDVPTVGDTKTYQLWLIDDDGATSAGLFRPAEDGSVLERLDGVDPTGFVLGLTEEPVGGSDSPTLPILAST
ncbi:MAG TPA: anti-sigma factor [Ilumatobacteraceae bacterium]|nr:anti-sigma factor [Ilumatobacteraceae bacterium]